MSLWLLRFAARRCARRGYFADYIAMVARIAARKAGAPRDDWQSEIWKKEKREP